MSRKAICAVPLTVLALAGCGGSSGSGSGAGSGSGSAYRPLTTSTRATARVSGTTSQAFLTTVKSTHVLGSTVPANGDVNPYGIALLTATVGKLHAGSLLVSNFNDKANNQGTGTTIVELTPAGRRSVFSTIRASALPGSCPGGVGLTTALSVLPGGYVVVGSLPTTNGKSATAKLGCLIVLDSSGRPIGTIAGARIAGPWDMTSTSQGSVTTLFVSNALNGGAARGAHTVKNSTVLRIRLRSGAGAPPKLLGEQVIAKGIPWRDDPNALVIGPTGLALAADGTLYLADTLSNRIAAIPQAMTRTTAVSGGGTTVSSGGRLNQPLGLTLAPNGDILTANAGDGNIVETTPGGKQVAARAADTKTGAGSLFGLVVSPAGTGIFYVDDGDNTVRLLH
jgi:hypothetical protein